jgi:dihydroorotate dehydrogenase
MDSSNWNELSYMLIDYDKYISVNGISEHKEFVEINIGCTNKLEIDKNLKNRIIAFEPLLLARLLENISLLKLQNISIGLKLSPYIDIYLLEEISKVILYYSNIIYYIVCSNSIPNGMVINSVNKKPTLSISTGDISGIANKLLAISNIYQFTNIFKKNLQNNKLIYIFGCGGIENSNDIIEYLNAGAICVQIGRVLYLNGISKVSDIANNLVSKL